MQSRLLWRHRNADACAGGGTDTLSTDEDRPELKLVPEQEPKGFVYFVRASNGLIKIGFTRNVKRRLNAMATDASGALEIIGVMRGSRRTEERVQGMFMHLQTHGEWHRPGLDLLSFIAHRAKPWDDGNQHQLMFEDLKREYDRAMPELPPVPGITDKCDENVSTDENLPYVNSSA